MPKTLKQIFLQEAGGKFPFRAKATSTFRFDEADFYAELEDNRWLAIKVGTNDPTTYFSYNLDCWDFVPRPKPKKKIVYECYVGKHSGQLYWSRVGSLDHMQTPANWERIPEFDHVVERDDE